MLTLSQVSLFLWTFLFKPISKFPASLSFYLHTVAACATSRRRMGCGCAATLLYRLLDGALSTLCYWKDHFAIIGRGAGQLASIMLTHCTDWFRRIMLMGDITPFFFKGRTIGSYCFIYVSGKGNYSRVGKSKPHNSLRVQFFSSYFLPNLSSFPLNSYLWAWKLEITLNLSSP